ncbi:MAG TPA: aminotransferase class I/II-fold pyridoxal phosphate-dependent enzyme, partial [Polyangiaceae bacterium]|nr:aminotransferase class I/II-fold pyridoxal phosphate-dependent enzyme [Polyangiaceae bacterium]
LRRRLDAELRALGLRVHPSEAPFVLAALGPGRTAGGLRRALLERHGILLRDAASFGLPNHVRVAARPPEELHRLTVSLKEELRR